MIAASSAERETVERQLETGERIEWIGRPNPKKWFLKDDGLIVPFGLFAFCSLVVFEIFAMQAPNNGWAVGVFGLPAVAGAAYLAFGYVSARVYRWRHTTYAVTNRRVLSIVHRVWGRETVDAADLDALPMISPDASGPDGRGSLGFGLTSVNTSNPWEKPGVLTGRSFASYLREHPPGLFFYDIDDPTTVARLIKRLRDEGNGP